MHVIPLLLAAALVLLACTKRADRTANAGYRVESLTWPPLQGAIENESARGIVPTVYRPVPGSAELVDGELWI